jgi:uncharacterized protein (DUF1778 family)
MLNAKKGTMKQTDDSDVRLGIPLTPRQYRQIEQAAALEQMPPEDWATQKLLAEAVDTVEQETTFQEVNEEFDRILDSMQHAQAAA